MGCTVPLQTAIKCSVLRMWPIVSVRVCVLTAISMSGWKICAYGERKNRQKSGDFCSFSANLCDPAELECHNIVLKGIVCCFCSIFFHLWWRKLMLQLTFSAICFEQVLSSEQVFIFFFLFFAVYFLKVQCSANLSCVMLFTMNQLL